MSTSPLDQQQQQQPPPPPLLVTDQAYTTQTGHASVGPVIAVVTVIIILGIIAGMIGRICTGRGIFLGGNRCGQYDYDWESWMETKCSSCIDGHVDPIPTRPVNVPVAMTVEEVLEQQQTEEQDQDKSEEQQQEQRSKDHDHQDTSES